MGSSIIQAETFIKEISLRTKDKDMEKCIGSMEVTIKAIGVVVYKKERVSFIVLMRVSKREYLKIIK